MIPGSAKSTRLETRVNGSDTNPYLALAAALASGLYGIERKLSLPRGPSRAAATPTASAPVLPRNLDEATRRFEQSELARELLGDGVRRPLRRQPALGVAPVEPGRDQLGAGAVLRDHLVACDHQMT